MKKNTLNLLFIDDEQLYAEHLIEQLSAYFDEVNLGFWDEKAEFVKSLRQEWDVLVFHRAYDMNFTDVVGILQEEQVDLPIIHLVQNAQNATLNDHDNPEIIHGDMIKSLVQGEDKLIISAICLQADYIHAKRQTAHLKVILKEAEQRASILIKNSKSAVAYIDQGVHVFANDPYLELFGYQAMEDIIGVPVVDLIAGGNDIKGFKQFLRKFDKGDRSQVEFAFESKRTDDSTFASKLQLAAATLDGEPVIQIIIQQNDNNGAELAKKLAAAERQDSLTGLSNRLAFTELLNGVREDVVRGDAKSAAVIYIRMDGVGKIHSSVGLMGVDTAVKQVAWALDETAKKLHNTAVSRFSDTSFALVLENVKQDDAVMLAKTLAQRVDELLIEVGSRTVTASLSIGVVMMDANTPEASVVLSRAMDTAHEINPDEDDNNKVKVFDISAIAGTDDSVMAEYIQTALTQNKFILKYQPIYDINTDTSNLFEVFITLPQADGTEMTYEKLAPIAKRHHLLEKIDRWMLINASKKLAQMRQTEPATRLLVGLSSSTLSDTQLPDIITQLGRAVGGGQALTLQFSEQDLVDYMAVAKRQFINLANISCPVGMNGFGVTAKSAEVLGHLSPSMVRLARSYTKDLDREANLTALKGLINTASEKGADVLMPYIEEASAMSIAWSVGARYLQGDYLQPASTEIILPVPAEV